MVAGRRVVGKRIAKGMMGEAGDPGYVVSWMPGEETESGRMKCD